MDFEPAIRAQLAGAAVRAAPLVAFDFRSRMTRLWPGFGPLEAGGYTWEGLGNLGALSQINTGISGSVDEITFTLAAPAEALAYFNDDAEESNGREVSVYLQFFDIRRTDEAGNWVDWLPLGDPLAMFVGTMGPLKVQRDRAEPAGGRPSRVMSVIASNGFVNRSRPAYAYYSDRDQKARNAIAGNPDDNFFVNASRTIYTVPWPVFTA